MHTYCHVYLYVTYVNVYTHIVCKDYGFFPEQSRVISENLPFLLTSARKGMIGVEWRESKKR